MIGNKGIRQPGDAGKIDKRKWHELHLEWWPGVHCIEEGWGWDFCQTACMILQKLKRNLGTKRKLSDLGIGWRIEIIRRWSYKSFLKTNWQGPECLAIDFVKTWGREPIVRVWVRAEQDSNRWIGEELSVLTSNLSPLIYSGTHCITPPELLLSGSQVISMLLCLLNNVSTRLTWPRNIIWYNWSFSPS